MATHPGQLKDRTAVRVQKLHRSFSKAGGVLNGLDLDINPGEFVALIGRSGSGKSTLLRALAGLDRDVTGHGAIDVPDRVSVVFQDSRLLPWRRILDNVTFGLRGKDARERGREALAEVGLAGREKAWPHELSGGEQQRVALARALANEPSVLLADEPTGNLDSSNTRDVLRLLRRAHDGGQAILMVTHDARVASLADRVINLFDGMVADDAKIVPIPRTMKGVADVLELRG
jgi:sulfonate transport system ATP-binding protein